MRMAETMALQNERAALRFNKALPEVFPAAVLTHARARRWTPPTPRLAIDSYWRAHPLRADRLARALATRSGAPAGWRWRLKSVDEPDLPASFRAPPAPYREKAFTRGPGHCVICGQIVYRLGWHVDLWHRGPNKNAVWHTACVTAWQLWNAPSDHAKLLRNGRAGAAPKAERGCGGPRRSTIVCRCSGSGESIATPTGRHYWAIGACPTYRSSIARRMPKKPPPKQRPEGEAALSFRLSQ